MTGLAMQTNYGGLLLCKFIDRDQDGYISVDDIFNAQALIMQRSELYLKVRMSNSSFLCSQCIKI